MHNAFVFNLSPYMLPTMVHGQAFPYCNFTIIHRECIPYPPHWDALSSSMFLTLGTVTSVRSMTTH